MGVGGVQVGKGGEYLLNKNLADHTGTVRKSAHCGPCQLLKATVFYWADNGSQMRTADILKRYFKKRSRQPIDSFCHSFIFMGETLDQEFPSTFPFCFYF